MPTPYDGGCGARLGTAPGLDPCPPGESLPTNHTAQRCVNRLTAKRRISRQCIQVEIERCAAASDPHARAASGPDAHEQSRISAIRVRPERSDWEMRTAAEIASVFVGVPEHHQMAPRI